MESLCNLKKHLIISGKVQGVGYRYWLQALSTKLNVQGWVRNLKTGEVEAVVIGEEKIIQEIINHCKSGPANSLVEKVQISDTDEEHNKNYFEIYTTE